MGIDATTLEANAAVRSIVCGETGEDYTTFLARLTEASGMATLPRVELARFDRSRKKKASNAEWIYTDDPDARVSKMKDGRTHLADKAEHAVDLGTDAVVSVTVQGADTGDTASMVETLIAAAEQVDAMQLAKFAEITFRLESYDASPRVPTQAARSPFRTSRRR